MDDNGAAGMSLRGERFKKMLRCISSLQQVSWIAYTGRMDGSDKDEKKILIKTIVRALSIERTWPGFGSSVIVSNPFSLYQRENFDRCCFKINKQ